MRLASVHKAICIIALVVIAALLFVELLLSEDKSGLHVLDGNLLFMLIVVCFYGICIASFIIGFRYAALQTKRSRLFWWAICLTVIGCLVTIPAGYTFIKKLFVAPDTNFFSNLNFFGISENRTRLLKYQKGLFTLLAVLQIPSIFTIIRLRKTYQAAESLADGR